MSRRAGRARPYAQPTSERQLQQAVLELAGRLGWLCYDTFDSRRSQAGFPDLVCVRPPRLLVAELKAADGRLTREQARWLGALRGTGAETYTWTPADWHALVVERVLR